MLFRALGSMRVQCGVCFLPPLLTLPLAVEPAMRRRTSHWGMKASLGLLRKLSQSTAFGTPSCGRRLSPPATDLIRKNSSDCAFNGTEIRRDEAEMDQPYHDPMRAPYTKERNYSGIGMSSGVVLLAAATIVAVAYYMMGGHVSGAPTAVDPPAVNAAPAPAARNPAPAPETTGRPAPRSR
jgi:hypothetical protein